MKKLLIAGSALPAAALAYYFLQPDPQLDLATARPATLSDIPEKSVLRTNADAWEVFRRTFWRDPAPEDRILHAGRREWVGKSDNVRRWQWFPAVEPGAALTTWLKETNPFNLARIASLPPKVADGLPSWFPSGPTLTGLEVFQSPNQAMTIIFDPAGSRLFATDNGHGFAAAEHPAANASSTPPIAPRQDPSPTRARN